MSPKRKRGGGRRPPARPPRTRSRASLPEPVETVATEEEEEAAAGDAGENLNLEGKDSDEVKEETLAASGGEVVGEVGEGKFGGDGEGDGCCAVLRSNCEGEADRKELEKVEVTSLQVEENDGEGEGKDSILELEKREFVQEDEEDPEEILNEAGDDPEEVLDESQNDHIMEDGGEEAHAEEVREVESVVRDDGNMQMGENDDSKGMGDGEDNQDNDELEVDPAEFMHDSLSERIKQKEFEIFVTGLSKDAIEEDLIKVFGVFGEIRATRILKNPISQRSKGYAFIRYATVGQAKRALNELKGGIEVRGKRVDISAGEDNDTLYVGNICKTWTKEVVLKKMRSCGIKHIKEIYRPEDPISEGKYKGFVLLVFSNHVDAMSAFQRLRKHDAIFGCGRSARVAFARSSMHPSDESLLQVKTVYIEGIPDSWDEEKLEVHCKQYGEVEKIELSKNFAVAKRKDFAYVSFASRESAVACIDNTNNAQVGEEGMKLKANLARPQNKGRLVMQGPRGGFKIRTNLTEAGLSGKLEGHVKSKAVEAKERGHGSFRGGRGGQSLKPHFRAYRGSGGSGLQGHQGGEQCGSGNHGGGGKKDSKRFRRKAFQERQKRGHWWEGGAEREGAPQTSLKSSKKSRGNLLGRPTNVPYTVNSTTAGYHQHGYGPHPGPKRLYSETQPDSGYFGSSAKHGQGSFGYRQIVSGAYDNDASSAAGYAGGTAAGYAGGTASGYAGGTAAGYPGGTAPGYPGGTTPGYFGGTTPIYPGGTSPLYSEGRYAGGTAPGYAGGSVGQASYSVQYPSYHGYESHYPYPYGSHTYASGEYPSHAAYQSSSGTYPPNGGFYPARNGPYLPSGGSHTSTTGAYPHAAGAYPPHRPYY